MVILVSSLGCACQNGNSVVITYNANGGDVSPAFETVPTGGSVVLPPPTFGGYIFNGWYTKAGMRAGSAGYSYIVNETETLYAQWTPSGSAGYVEKYAYVPGYSQYYVEYEIQYCVNEFRYEVQVASAYFDTYSAAWAFSLTGGPSPALSTEYIWVDGVNRWWVAHEAPSYYIEIENYGDEHTYPYYGTGIFPGTDLAPDLWDFRVEEYYAQILGVDSEKVGLITRYIDDPGYFGFDDEIIVHESWWTVTYSGWVLGDPDVYTVRIVPINDVIYSCR